MTHENLQPKILNPDGTVNEAVLDSHYGLGIEEAMQEVKFGEYTGTVAEMLDDVRCPVGGRMRSAYEKNGIDGVIGQFTALNMLDPDFKVEIAKETIERSLREKKSNSSFL